MLTMTDNNLKGNLTTVIKLISMPIAGYAIGLFISYGINIPVDQATLAEIIAAILFLGVGFMDAKFPNTFNWLDNNKIVDVDPAAEYESIETNDAAGEEIDQ